jgi:DNA-directed RNA polymerase omega subunit
LVAPHHHRYLHLERTFLSAQDVLVITREWKQSEMTVNSKDRLESGHLTPAPAKVTPNAIEDQWPGIDSRYRLIVVAALRSKQLLHGSLPRIMADPSKRRNTSIALEEVKQGLVPFTITTEAQKNDADGLHGQEP